MSGKIITPKERQISAATFARHPEIFKTFLSKYKTQYNALEAVDAGLYESYYEDENVMPPVASTMIDAVYNHFQGESSSAPLQLAQSRDALEFQTWVIDENGQAYHAKVHRKTQEVEVRSADPLTHFCASYEKKLPGFTFFVGNLISLYDCTGDQLKLWSEEVGYAACMPSPFKYRGLKKFLGDFRDPLFVKSAEGTPAVSTALAMAERVSKMSVPDYLELSLAFFCYATGIAEEDIHKTFDNHPFRLIGHSQVDGQPFFKYHSKAGVDRSRSKYYVYQAGPWKVQSVPPTTMQDAHLGLQNGRVHRRENAKGYGGLTNGHSDGGDLPEERVRVTNALSLAYVQLKTRNIELRLGSPLTAQYVDEALKKKGFKHTWKFVMSAAEAMAAFGDEDHKSKYVAARTTGVLLIDLVSTAEPSFPKNTDMAKVWGNHYANLLPAEPYIAFRKTPPPLADKVPVYKMGTIHAFDALTTSLPELKGAGVVCRMEEGVVKFAEEEFSLKSYTTQKDYLIAQWADNRRKLEMFFTVSCRVKFTTAINLWSPPPVVSKKNRPALELRSGGSYEKAKPGADFDADFEDDAGQDDPFGGDFDEPADVSVKASVPSVASASAAVQPKPFSPAAMKKKKRVVAAAQAGVPVAEKTLAGAQPGSVSPLG